MRDLVPFVQFKKRKKHPWKSVTFSKVTLLKIALLHGCFLRFLNCEHGTKSRNAPQLFLCFTWIPSAEVSTLAIRNVCENLHDGLVECRMQPESVDVHLPRVTKEVHSKLNFRKNGTQVLTEEWNFE